ncbi:3-oxoacyl-ACP reductase FabG [Streptomyces bacillaris]|uniref:3-oxoacyl-ACP reductase FabG n=1 Tax=Streptomyces bacillaris TaxID=68179 RepID=UPI0034602DFF
MSERSVFVTGASRGIGLAIARAFTEQGDRVAVGYRGGGPPDGLTGVHCDVTDPASVDAAFTAVEAENGPVSVLVANAGITQDSLALRMTDEEFAAPFETNLAGTFRVARRAAPGMLEGRWGRMVFVSSVMGTLGSPGQANYAASKSGLIGLARSLAREFGRRGITVNTVAPGLVETDMSAAISDRRRDELLAMTPVGRVGTAREVAEVVRFLASEGASYITGGVIPVSGGMGMGS